MPKPARQPRADKVYSSNAARQKAYRERHAEPYESELAALARSLHFTVRRAAAAGDVQAQALAAERADETVRRVIAHFAPKESGAA